MLKELMLPAEVKLLKPKPAGCWHWVPAMMHGLLLLCGPRVLPIIGPVSVKVTADAKLVSVSSAADAARVVKPILTIFCIGTPSDWVTSLLLTLPYLTITIEITT